uniref:Proteasome subunit beta n=1 Tax=Bionectria ochroleuca TaxID=29856 RepID=A0A8H7TR06_BIOOC
MSDPSKINGGACVAMVGKDCVAIACDLRLGMQALTISNNFPKVFQYGDVFLGLTGLATDVNTVSDLFRYKTNMYRLREERPIAPRTMANLVSSSSTSAGSAPTSSHPSSPASTPRRASPSSAASIVSAALTLPRTSSSPVQPLTSCLVSAKAYGRPIWNPTTSSKQSPRLFSTPSTVTHCPVGVRTST